MPLLKIIRESDYTLGIWKIEENLEELNSMLPDPGMYKQDILMLKMPGRQLERLAVRVLLFHLIGEQKQIGYYVNGAPFLSDNSYRISISHTKGYVAVITGESHFIGIDIEQFGEKVNRISGRYMRDDEIPSLYNRSYIWSLLLHWSAKETMFKALMCENVDFKEHLFVYPFAVQECGVFCAQEFKTSHKRRFFISYIISRDFVLTWTYLKENGEAYH